MTAPLIVDNVSKSYKSHKNALVRANLTLNQGEIFGLIGLNGAGKTTLIKVVLDLIQANEGQVSCFGFDSKDTKARQNLSYLPEKFQPPRHLSGKEYLSLAVSYYGGKLDLEKAKKIAAELDLRETAITTKIGGYSKGMGQKVGLIGAFMVDAPLYILDEPMSGLDPKARIALKRLLVEQKQANRTVFFSSHILSDIDEICDRIGVIHHGELFYVGTPSAFKQQYQDSNLEHAFLKAIDGLDAAKQKADGEQLAA